MRVPFVVLMLAALAAPPALSQGPASVADDATILRRAEAAYDRGIAAQSANPNDAKGAFAESAATYGELTEQRGIRNPRLLANLGNAYLLSGDTGRAVLSYRRAARIDPTDRTVRAGLDVVRSRVGTIVEPGPSTRMYALLAGWRSVLTPDSLLTVSAFAWVAGWLAFAVGRLSSSRRHVSRISAAVIVLGTLGIGLVVCDEAIRGRSSEAVLIADSTVGRKGPGGSAYEPSFDKPLAGGVEVSVLEERGDWLRVRLADGRETWVPRSALERV